MLLSRILVPLTGLCFCFGFSLRDQQGRVVGGSPADILEAPYQLSLAVRGFGHSCGASLVAPDLALTAAHCVMGIDPYRLQIRAGSTSSTYGGQLRDVVDVAMHPDFSPVTMDYDMALLKLEYALELSEEVAVINLADEGEYIEDGTDFLVTGWGAVMEGGARVEFLRKVSLPQVSHIDCALAYQNMGTVTGRMVCAGALGGGRDSCQGDSGGPLAINHMKRSYKHLRSPPKNLSKTETNTGFNDIDNNAISEKNIKYNTYIQRPVAKKQPINEFNQINSLKYDRYAINVDSMRDISIDQTGARVEEQRVLQGRNKQLSFYYGPRLVGVVSWGVGCARPEYPGVYSSVAALGGWIRKTAEEFNSIIV